VLMAGVVALSERRAAFVSSVTHELRTPLTTFRMYADMLARGMVPDAERRQQYHETLRVEAERLTHLVENVLSYARLERGREVQRHESVTVEGLVERLQGRLAERAEQADMQLLVTIEQETGEKILTTDVGVVEQILFNLVDNSAKYAAHADDRRIHWGARTTAGDVELTIGDHGPGFTKPSRARRSQAFSKTAEEAAVTAPGVGLGLALCRRLAKQLGGRLEITDSQEGVKAILHLPLGAAGS
jgi:signal transduction histidine kinase